MMPLKGAGDGPLPVSHYLINGLHILFFSLSLIGLIGCSDNEKQCVYNPEINISTVDITFEQLEDSVVGFLSEQHLADFFSRHPTVRDFFFNRPHYPNDSVFFKELYRRLSHPGMDTLLLETRQTFGDLTALKNELIQAFGHVKYYYPHFTPPKIQTVVTGLESDLYVSDSLVIIGLDYFIGPTATYRPNTYQYILRRYEKNFIVPSILLLFGIDPLYNKSSQDDKTVLADMITYGKAYYFAKQMLPCVPDSVLIGYTGEEIEGAEKYSDLIWKRMIEDEVLYATSHLVKQKYLAERPKTLEVGVKCPGRIATWVGWAIVKAYMRKHPNEKLPTLMKKSNASLLLKQSAYKPG